MSFGSANSPTNADKKDKMLAPAKYVVMGYYELVRNIYDTPEAAREKASELSAPHHGGAYTVLEVVAQWDSLVVGIGQKGDVDGQRSGFRRMPVGNSSHLG